MLVVRPGDVLVVNASRGKGPGSGGWWVKLRAWILRRDNQRDHVAVVTHVDEHGTQWGIEGKPSSVGWVDLKKYLQDPTTIGTMKQPKSEFQRDAIVAAVKDLLGTKYDWVAVGLLGSEVSRVMMLWNKMLARRLVPDWSEAEVPGAVLCSSIADLGQEKAGLDSPGGTKGTRFTTPDDWTAFIRKNEAMWDYHS